jgi:hypothetical protein
MIIVTVIGMIIIAPVIIGMIPTPMVIIIGFFDARRGGRWSVQRPDARRGLQKA